MARKNDYIAKIDKFIGEKIYSLRLGKGLSRQQLAEVIGVTHQQLQKYEKGTNRISAGRLVLIATALDKTPEFFYAGFDEDTAAPEENTMHQRMCIEVSRNFMKLRNSDHQNAINSLLRSLVKESA
jgi:transcriptional regulator with XRE-family HTH domain